MSHLATTGFQIIPQLLPAVTVDRLLHLIQANAYNDGFGIREFLPNNPEVIDELRKISSFGSLLRAHLIHPTCVRSIYFDKPPKANWVVGWHQDLTMNLRSTPDEPGWLNVRKVANRIVAQPPLSLLQEMVTLRLHLDNTDESNGALRVVSASHYEGTSDGRPNLRS